MDNSSSYWFPSRLVKKRNHLREIVTVPKATAYRLLRNKVCLKIRILKQYCRQIYKMILTGVGHDAASGKTRFEKIVENLWWSHPPPPCTTKAKIMIKKIFQSFSDHEDTTN